MFNRCKSIVVCIPVGVVWFIKSVVKDIIEYEKMVSEVNKIIPPPYPKNKLWSVGSKNKKCIMGPCRFQRVEGEHFCSACLVGVVRNGSQKK